MAGQRETPKPQPKPKMDTETRARVIGRPVSTLIFTLSTLPIALAARNLDDPLQYFRVVATSAALVALAAAGIRVYAHQRSSSLDLYGKYLGLWAAALTVLALATQWLYDSL